MKTIYICTNPECEALLIEEKKKSPVPYGMNCPICLSALGIKRQGC